VPQADVRHFAVLHCVNLVACESHDDVLHDDLPHIVGCKRALLEKTDDRVERSLNGRSDCPLFDIRESYLVALTESVDQLRRISFEPSVFLSIEPQRKCRHQENVVQADKADF